MTTVKEVVTKAIEDWQQNNSPESIRSHTMNMLNKGRDDIIVQMAGFEKQWGSEWKVDHCNARRSAVENYVTRLAQEAVEEWIAENIENLPTMTDDMKEAFLADYKEAYERTMRKAIYEHAQRRATKDAKALVEQLYQELGEPRLVEFPEDTKNTEPNWW